MNAIELNRIAIWRAKPLDTFSVRESAPGRQYVENKVYKKTAKTTYRYAKNYEVEGVKFCLMVITYDKDSKEVEKDLDRIALVISKEEAEKGEFAYTNYFIKERTK